MRTGHWSIQLILFILIYFSSGKGELNGQAALERDLEAELTSETLSEKSLHAFEARVSQKLRDFSERVGILSDPRRGGELRERAREQALELFIDPGQRTLAFPEREGEASEWKEFAVDALLDSLEGGHPGRVRLRFEAVETEAYRREGERYEAAFTARMLCEYYDEGELLARKALDLKGRTVLKKVPKRFGAEEKEVWELFLGEMERQEE